VFSSGLEIATGVGQYWDFLLASRCLVSAPPPPARKGKPQMACFISRGNTKERLAGPALGHAVLRRTHALLWEGLNGAG